MGVLAGLLLIVIVPKTLGGLIVIVGWQTWIVFFYLAGFYHLLAAMFHSDLGDQNEMIQFVKYIVVVGRSLSFSAKRDGYFSLSLGS